MFSVYPRHRLSFRRSESDRDTFRDVLLLSHMVDESTLVVLDGLVSIVDRERITFCYRR